MMLTRWNPNRTLLDINRDMGRFIDDFFSNQLLSDADVQISPRVDIEENDNEFIITAEVPGVDKKDININYHDGMLTISGQKGNESERKDKNFHRIERSYGSFSRSLSFHTSVVQDKIDATYKDGILTVVLPKAEEAKPKQIDIKVK